MCSLPTGTVTLLFTDIEGSTKLLRELGAGYADALTTHRRVLRDVFAAHGGVEVDTQGDAFFVAFDSATQAVAAAAASQAALRGGPILVRIGVHTGQPSLTEEGYVGLDVHKGARIAACGHGGQVIMSADTRVLVHEPVSVDLGEHRLKDFDEPIQLFQLGEDVFPPLKTISNTNLPRPASSFIGRGTEVADVATLVRQGARLVTLTGPGGSGKTRLGIEAASELVPRFRAGVFWIGLATVRDAALVVETIGRTLGVQGDVASAVGEREMLLLLDNFEQVVEAAPNVARLVATCPNLSVLVSSRELLRVDGEVEYPVPPLAGGEAVALFCERAHQEPSDEIAELCARLDNLPLAVELAAARAKVLSPAQMLERLAERLDLFRGGRDTDPRQATLRATIDWSHDLLSPPEARLFARLAVFAGGCTLASAQRVSDADLDSMQSLVEKSLVRHTQGRFWMLETIREFALERLQASGEADAVARRYFEHYLAIAEAAELSAEAGYGRSHDLVLPETDNLRAAFDWAVGVREVELGYRLAISLENFWISLDPFEGLRRFESLFATGSGVQPILRARALRCYGGCSNMAGKNEQAQRAYEESLAIFEEVGDERDVAVVLHRLGINALNLDKPELSREPLERSLEIFRRLGDERGVAQAIGGLGYLSHVEGDLDEAVHLWEASLGMVRDTGFIWWELGMLAALAEVAVQEGRYEDAAARICEQLALWDRVADRQNAVYAFALLARAESELGNSYRAGVAWGAIEAEESRAPIGVWESERDDYASPLLVDAWPEFDRGRQEGRRMAFGDAIAFALDRTSPGRSGSHKEGR